MPVRQSDRKRHRAPCAVTIDGRRHSGFMLDYSSSGLFIQTSASPKRGQRLDLELTLHGETLPMHVEVVRRRAVPAQLRTVAGGGIGVRILSAPEAFYALIAAEQESRASEEDAGASVGPARQRPTSPPRGSCEAQAPPAEAAARAPARFRVRVRATQGNRSRSLEVEAGGESEASRLALEELGEGWKVLEVSPLG